MNGFGVNLVLVRVRELRRLRSLLQHRHQSLAQQREFDVPGDEAPRPVKGHHRFHPRQRQRVSQLLPRSSKAADLPDFFDLLENFDGSEPTWQKSASTE